MAPLRFRAWDNQNKKWLLGYDMPHLGGFSLFGECMMFGEWSEVLGHFMHADMNPADLMVMQSTGLHDKNGVEIFEGDILAHYEMKGVQFVMGWEQRTAQFSPYHPHDCYEVIGNIHENPELLTCPKNRPSRS